MKRRIPLSYFPTITPSRWLWSGALLAVLLAVTLAIVTRVIAPLSAATSGSRTALGSHTIIGGPAPQFTLPAEQDGQTLAQPVSLVATEGHPTLLIFFYSLCPHCSSQIETVHTLETQEAAHGLRVLYIDSPAESPGIVAAYAQRLGVPAQVLLDRDGALATEYGIGSYPGIVLIDAKGIVRMVWVGETSEDTLRTTLAPLLMCAIPAVFSQTGGVAGDA